MDQGVILGLKMRLNSSTIIQIFPNFPAEDPLIPCFKGMGGKGKVREEKRREER